LGDEGRQFLEKDIAHGGNLAKNIFTYYFSAHKSLHIPKVPQPT
jgi:hypothetical protein